MDNEKLDDDYVNMHIKYFSEGIFDCMLASLSNDCIWDVHRIDTQRYSPDSPREFSYRKGWEHAAEKLKSKNIEAAVA